MFTVPVKIFFTSIYYNLYSHVENGLKKCYNVFMCSLGISSAYSAYSAAVNPVYEPYRVQNKQDALTAEKSAPESTYPGEINDEAIISDEAQNLYAAEKNSQNDGLTTKENKDSSETEFPKKEKSASGEDLTPQEEQEIAKLKARDSEVRAHEQAHIAAAAGITTSAPTYDYQTGPDGKRYAVGGEVTVSFVESNDPEQNLANAEAMKAAALAPADPSSQDRAVASNADKIIAQAKQELTQNQEETLGLINDNIENRQQTNNTTAPISQLAKA